MNKNKIRMQQAENVGKFSKSNRNKVGAILIKDNHIICEGYNGTITGASPDILEYFLPHGESKDNNPDLYDVSLLKTIECPICLGKGNIISNLKIPYIEPITCNTCLGTGKLDIYNKTNENNTFHAEMNLLMFCAKEGISAKDGILFVTLSPCLNCAKLILQAGIKKVYYKDKYRDTSGIDLLKKYIKVEQIED